MKKGNFVISLDFELFWGVRDLSGIDDYGENVKNVWEALPQILYLFKNYDIRATFATVGMLFHKNMDELIHHCPNTKPSYEDENLSPYNGHFELLNDAKNFKYHFAPELLTKIINENHEIATHSYSHYYCLEKGQNTYQFDTDLKSYIQIATKYGVETKSIVFPRNQYNTEYLDVCIKNNIKSYRGNENHWAFRKEYKNYKIFAQRLIRFIDRYVNVTGHHCNKIVTSGVEIINIPSSRFLAPVNQKLKFLEVLRLRRITKSLEFAAQNGLTYHLWWHPHNFGKNLNENLSFLESILKSYKELNSRYNFPNATMSDFTNINPTNE